MTDGKSMLSSPVLVEHMAGEHKHLEMSRLLKAHTSRSTGTNTEHTGKMGVVDRKKLTRLTCHRPSKESNGMDLKPM